MKSGTKKQHTSHDSIGNKCWNGQQKARGAEIKVESGLKEEAMTEKQKRRL